MKKVVHVGHAALGEGMPKIAVPLMEKDVQALEDAARRAVDADILELRLDSISPEMNPEILKDACKAVRNAGKPVLVTMRTLRDGGAGDADPDQYEILLNDLIRERLCDAVDVELSAGEARFARITEAAHRAGIPVVGSSHDFTGTPATEAMLALLRRMAELNADVCKIAVMPHDKKDVAALMAACVQADDELCQPVIAIAMGKLGAATRLCGEVLGSCLSFGTAGKASAPGQMDARTLKKTLLSIHQAMADGK